MKYFCILFIFIFVITKLANAEKKPFFIKCANQKNSTVLDFKINKHQNSYTTAYRKIKNKFIEIGEVVGQKKSSFILFEDKYAYLGVDLAWHYDNNTHQLQPVLLSKGTIKLEKLPEKLSCLIN